MKLVFDTNIIHEDFHLYGLYITKLCSAAEKLGYDLMVPDVVVDEMVNQYRKKMLQHFPGYAGVLKMVTRTQGSEEKIDKDAFVGDKVREYEAFLRQRLIKLGIKVIAYPQVDIKALVSKELSVKKPFKELKDGIVGYRDSLIWECIKSICQPPQDLLEDPQIEFLSGNTKDFAGADKKLHPDLVSELKFAGFAENSVSLVPNVEEFFKNRIDTELEELDNIKDALLKVGKFNRFDLLEETARVLSQGFIDDALNGFDFDSGQSDYLPGYVEDPTVNNVNDPIIDDVMVRRLSDQSVLIEVLARVSVDFDFFIENTNYLALDIDQLPIVLEKNWNDYYMWCEGSATVSSSMAFRATPKLGKVLSVEVQVIGVDM